MDKSSPFRKTYSRDIHNIFNIQKSGDSQMILGNSKCQGDIGPSICLVQGMVVE